MGDDLRAGALAAAGDDRFMAAALDAARRGWGRTAPNPMVGAVVVRADEVVATGWHAEFGGPHAEAVALGHAGGSARGATVYVTLEPCAHAGKTPPCADALVRAGVARVVIGARDPNPEASGGIARLRAAGIEVVTGVRERDALDLNAPFHFSFGAARPWLTLKLALSLDAAIADADGRSKWITGRAARTAGHELRAGNDAVAVGIGTVLADDPSLTVRDAAPPRVPPVRVVFDRQARLPLASALARSARETPVIVVAGEASASRRAALEGLGVEVLESPSLEGALTLLRGRGIRALLVEGGAALAAAFLERALVDRLVIFQAPVVLGAGALRPFERSPAAGIGAATRLRVIERETLGEDLMTVYAMRELPCSPD